MTRPSRFPARFSARSRARLAVATTALGVGLGLACALAARAQDAQAGQPPLPTTQIQAGMHLIRAEVADSPDTRAKGLMFRPALGPNEGMLFVFEGAATHCFWMKNTRIPLSIAFIDDSGQIANLADMQPFDETSHCAARPVRFALEMEQGWFARRGVKAGARLGNAALFRAPATKP
ncbi:MAG: DUF192 domain-containing protein [Burkholderiaceae bacterium]